MSRPRWHRVARTTTALVLTLVGSIALLAPAATGATTGGTAEGSRLVGVSLDGRRWSTELERPLFDPALRWVPGDVRTARLWVRNEAPDDGDVAVRLRPGLGLDTAESDALDITARAEGGRWHSLTAPSGHDLLAGEGLASGESVALDLRVRMPFSTRDAAMTLASDFGLDVTVADADAVAGVEGEIAGGEALLPNTMPLPIWATVLAVLLAVAASCGLLHPARRRRERDQP